MLDFKKENIVENVSNFTPYGTDPKKDKMVKSNNWENRLKIAKKGYGLNILVNDKQWKVRRAVLNYLKKNNLTLAEWCNQNNKEIDLRKLAFSQYPEVRITAIDSGYVYKKDEIYITPDCKFMPYGIDPEKDKMIKNNIWGDWGDRLEMVKEGYGLNVLINDEVYYVREAVAKQGYGLDILIEDKDWRVRAAVAEQGYGLDILINDENWRVRKVVEYYLTTHNLTLEQWKFNQNPSELSVSISKSLDINTLKSEIQILKDQINILVKKSKSLQEALENYTLLEKKNDENISR